MLHEGSIAEMKTGEGKTLVATLPTYLNALTGQGVHVVTVNDYLAERDGNWYVAFLPLSMHKICPLAPNSSMVIRKLVIGLLVMATSHDARSGGNSLLCLLAHASYCLLFPIFTSLFRGLQKEMFKGFSMAALQDGQGFQVPWSQRGHSYRCHSVRCSGQGIRGRCAVHHSHAAVIHLPV